MPEMPRSELRCEPSLCHVDVVDNKIRDISGRLPVELWRDVFKYACVDGGRTGCALSLVSRRIRKLSAGIRLQSICVIDMDRIRSLLHILERLPEHERRVRYLFIAAAPEQERSPIWCYHQHEREGVLKRRQDMAQDWRTFYPAFLALIAPHVEVLAIHIHRELLITVSLTNIPFPVLRDLSMGNIGNSEEQAMPQLSSVPLLRRLHVLGYATRQLVDDIVGIQSLEHVRFSGGGAVENFASRLSKSPAPSPGRSAGDRSTKLVIANKIPSFRCGNARRGWLRTYNNAKESLMQHDARDRFASITILKPSSREYDLELAIKDWREVVEDGGEGAWGNVEVPSQPASSARRIPQDTVSIAGPSPPDARERLLPAEAETAPSATVSEPLACLRSSPAFAPTTISPEPAPRPPTNPPPIASVAVETEQPVQIDAAAQLLHQPFLPRESPDSVDRD
jgi:hypothetical protein